MHSLNHTTLGFISEDGIPESYGLEKFNCTRISSSKISPKVKHVLPSEKNEQKPPEKQS
jgi:hypothetical protein